MVSEIKVSENGVEHTKNPTYYGRFDQALRRLLDRTIAAGLPEDADLKEAVRVVASAFATIADAARANQTEKKR